MGSSALGVLGTFIDLTPLGVRDGGGRPEMAVTIIATPAMDPAARRALKRKALVRRACQFGYTDAEVGLL